MTSREYTIKVGQELVEICWTCSNYHYSTQTTPYWKKGPPLPKYEQIVLQVIEKKPRSRVRHAKLPLCALLQVLPPPECSKSVASQVPITHPIGIKIVSALCIWRYALHLAAFPAFLQLGSVLHAII